jgi:hypothetical protein
MPTLSTGFPRGAERQPQTTARYAHLDADPLLRAANLIGERIESAINPPAVTISVET